MDPTRADRRRPAEAGRWAALGCGAILAGAAWAGPAQASEAGVSFYLLGSGGPGAAIMPPIRGVFLADTFYHYDGSAGADKQFQLGGNLVAGLDATVNANFTTVLWVPTTDFLGGTLGFGGILPFGEPDVTVSVGVTGPRGRQFDISRSDSKFVVGDPVLLGALGWTRGDTHLQLAALVNVPIGDYRAGQLANLAFHRWAGDVSLAASWRDAKGGWDVTGKTGFTFNGTNESTDYTTGTEWHLEGSVEKILSPAFSLGVQAYYFHQLTGDSGSGDLLGAFKGEVTAVGGTGAYNFKIAGKIPATLRLHVLKEFNATNRLEGTSVLVDFSMPLYVKLPPGAHP